MRSIIGGIWRNSARTWYASPLETMLTRYWNAAVSSVESWSFNTWNFSVSNGETALKRYWNAPFQHEFITDSTFETRRFLQWPVPQMLRDKGPTWGSRRCSAKEQNYRITELVRQPRHEEDGHAGFATSSMGPDEGLPGRNSSHAPPGYCKIPCQGSVGSWQDQRPSSVIVAFTKETTCFSDQFLSDPSSIAYNGSFVGRDFKHLV